METIQSKPIFIIKLSREDWAEQTQSDIFDAFLEEMKQSLPDYHVLVMGTDKENTEFEAFYPQDFGTVELEELKKIVMDTIKKPKPSLE